MDAANFPYTIDEVAAKGEESVGRMGKLIGRTVTVSEEEIFRQPEGVLRERTDREMAERNSDGSNSDCYCGRDRRETKESRKNHRR